MNRARRLRNTSKKSAKFLDSFKGYFVKTRQEGPSAGDGGIVVEAKLCCVKT